MVAVLAGTALVLAASASATVRKVAFTAVFSPNDYASLTVAVSPRARCTITVIYDTTDSTHADSGRRRADASPGAGRLAPRRTRDAGP